MRARAPERSAMMALIGIAMIMRMYWGLSLDFTYPLNAAWLCPILGLVLYLPFAFALHQAAQLGNNSIWVNLAARVPRALTCVVAAGFALLLVYDAAVTAHLTAISSNILALNDVSPILLLIPLVLVILCVVKLGIEALGNSAGLWLRVLPLFVMIILLVQFKNYRFGWLTPILGGGISSILTGGVYCAGCMALISLPWLLALPGNKHCSLLLTVSLSTIAAALLMMSQQLLIPAILGGDLTMVARIDLILNNGRMTLSPQIILDVLWFGNMLYLISAETISAAEYLRTILPKLPRWSLAAGVALAVGIAASTNGALMRTNSTVVCNLYALVGTALALLLLIALFGRRGGRA